MAAVGTFREMIFFSAEPVYCAAIIIYCRKYDAVPATATEPRPAALIPTPPMPQQSLDAWGPRLWSHSWDFRIAGSALVDDSSSLEVHRMNGVLQTPQGLYFNGSDQWADIDPFTWGGTTSIEVYCAIDQGADWLSTQFVWHFGLGQAATHLRKNSQGALGIFQVRRTDREKYKQAECHTFWEIGKWTHVVCVVEGSSMQMYKDGKLMAHKQDGQNPEIQRRNHMYLGKGHDGNFFHGTIAYLRIYDQKLTEKNVIALYENRDALTPQRKAEALATDALATHALATDSPRPPSDCCLCS